MFEMAKTNKKASGVSFKEDDLRKVADANVEIDSIYKDAGYLGEGR